MSAITKKSDLAILDVPETHENEDETSSCFVITRHAGFHMQFANGLAISVQWAPGNYCENRYKSFDAPKRAEQWESKDAEIAVFWPNGGFLPLDDYDQVRGWMTTDQVAAVITQVVGMTKEEVLKAEKAFNDAGRPFCLADLHNDDKEDENE